MSTFSVLIPDGENEHALWVARCLAQSGETRIYILSSKRWMPVRFSRHCRQYRFVPAGADRKDRLNMLVEMIKHYQADVLLPVSEAGNEFVATVYQTLKQVTAVAPVPEPNFLQTARSKWALTQFACQQKVPVPYSILVTSRPEFDRQLTAMEYPVLIKPIFGTDGQEIRRFETPSGLRKFLNEQNLEQFNGKYIIQRYVPGYDIDLSALCRQGEILAYTIQRSIISASERFGPQMAMEFIEQPQVLENGRKLLSALKWNGVAHIDMRYDETDGEFKTVDVNARYWGSLLGSFVVGVNFPYLACLVALEKPFPMPQYRPGQYLHATIAMKEMISRLYGKNRLSRFAFKETGLKFFVTDPLPEVVKRLLAASSN